VLTIRRLYVAAAFLLLIPIWTVDHLPTVDGPSHVYNAEIIRQIALGHDNALTRAFRLNPRIVPNWTGHALLALFMMVFPPAFAEKLLMTGIIALFFTGVWMYAGCDDERRHVWAFFAFPLAYNQLFQLGFYNYAISVGLSLVILAYWWPRRAQSDWKTVAITALLLVVCYFSHPMSTALTAAALFLFWLISSRRPMQLLMFVPVSPLMVLFALEQNGSKFFQPLSLKTGWDYLSKTQLLLVFDPRQLIFGRFYFALFIVLFIVTLTRQSLARQASVFLFLAIASLVLFQVMNSSAGNGGYVHERLALVFMLAPLAWFTADLPSKATMTFASAFMLVAIAEMLFLIKNYQHHDHATTRFLESTRGLGTNATLLPLLGDRDVKEGSQVVVLAKAINYAAIEKHLVNLDNYEAGTDYFPVVFAPQLQPDVFKIENESFKFDVSPYASMAEWIFTWKLDDESYLAKQQLAGTYSLMAANGDGRVYHSNSTTIISP